MPLFLTHGEELIRTRMDRNYWGRVRALKEDARFDVHDVSLSDVSAEVAARHDCVILDPFAIPSHPRFRPEHLARVTGLLERTGRRFLMVEDAHAHSYRGGMQAVVEFARAHDAEVICVYRSSMETFRAAGLRVHHLPHHVDAGVHRLRPEVEKTHDVVLYGATDEHWYPFRTRLFRLLRASPLRVLELRFPGYRTHDPNVCGDGLAEQINRAWMGVCTPSRARYLVAKYLEVALNGAVVAGRMPDDEDARFWGGDYVALDESMTDEVIVATLQAALEDQMRLRAMSAAMRAKLAPFTLEQFAAHLLDITDEASSCASGVA